MLQTLKGHTEWVNGVAAFTLPMARRASSLARRTIRCACGTLSPAPCSTRLKGTRRGRRRGALPDGTPRVLWRGDKTVRVWDPIAGTLLHTLEGHTNNVRASRRSRCPTARRAPLWRSNDKTVRVWDPVAGTALHTLEGLRLGGGVAAFTLPDGTPRALSGSHDKTVRVWDPVAGTALHTLRGHTRHVAASRRSRCRDGTPGPARGEERCACGTPSPAPCSTRSGTRTPCTASRRSRCPMARRAHFLWHRPTGLCACGPCRRHLAAEHENVWCVGSFTLPDGAARPGLVSGSADKTVRVWGTCESTLQPLSTQQTRAAMAAWRLDRAPGRARIQVRHAADARGAHE